MADNAFDKGVDYLKEVYDKLVRVEQLQESLEKAHQDAKRAQKALAQEEKQRDEEKVSAVKKRINEISQTYDKEIEVFQDKVKAIDNKREAHKEKKQKERYEVETKELRQEISDCELDIRNVLKQYHISAFCRTNLYYRLFLPKGIKDYVVLFFFLVLTLFLIPGGICVLGTITFLKDVPNRLVYYILFFVCCISLTFITYLIITNRTKVRYPKQLIHCRNQKLKIYAIRRQMRAVKNKINKDKDESEYNLGAFDSQIQSYRDEIAAIGEKKKEALREFENKKRIVVEREVMSSHAAQIKEYKEQIIRSENYEEGATKEIKELKLDISNNYESYLGKEYVNIEKLEVLIDIMEEEGLATVGEAIASYNGQKE